MLHPDIARWLVAAEHQRLAELARPRRPRPGAARAHPGRAGREGWWPEVPIEERMAG